ncbi:fungal chitosanase of glycosyl hydrolase group 75-domain-containing protein [Aspergillus heterothallicus]
MQSLKLLLLTTLLTLNTSAKNIPPALLTLYNKIRLAGPCTGPDLLKTGFYDQTDGSPPLWSYCQRHTSPHAIYLKGPGASLANMDIDCDGTNTTGPDPTDHRCTNSPDTQPQTAFQSLLQQPKYNISDLNTYIHPYIVLGNTGRRPTYRTFNPQRHGIHPLSLAAVVCNNKLVYGVWGDVNGDDGPPLVGEASLALATACFGHAVNGSNGWDGDDVLYLAFRGSGAVVPGGGGGGGGAEGVKWDARSFEEFEAGIEGLGDRLVEGLIGGLKGGEGDESGPGVSSREDRMNRDSCAFTNGNINVNSAKKPTGTQEPNVNVNVKISNLQN